MAEGDGPRSIDDELEGLILDEEFVRLARVREQQPRTRPVRVPADAPAAPIPSKGRRPWPRIVGGLLAVAALVAGMAALKARGVGQGDGAVTAQTEAGLYGPGDCVTWPDSEAGFATLASPEVVECSAPHRAEIVGSVRLDDETGYPTDARFGQLLDERCLPLVRRQLGHDLGPTDPFVQWALHPPIDGWRAGDRALWCGIVSRDVAPSGEPQLFSGPVR